ncbi:MAG: hypothetical protein K6E33_05555 [Lachnospiraceae bacterium]|nr:hypothetical protein [Lachnospiraceae bacterium]
MADVTLNKSVSVPGRCTACREISEKKKMISLPGISAYMTLEASLIVPIAFFVCILIVYSAAVLYNRSMLFADTYDLCFRASVHMGEPSEAQSYIDENKEGQFRLYFFTRGIEESSSVSEKEVTVNTSSTIVKTVGDYIFSPGDIWGMSSKAVCQREGPTEFLRKARAVSETVDTIRDLADDH